MIRAICVRCGAAKPHATKTCKRCNVDPTVDDALLVRSVYLSLARFESPDDHPDYESELAELARNIEAGSEIDFDERELTRLREQLLAVKQVSWPDVLRALVRIFLPAFVVLAAIYGAILTLRLAR